MVRKQNQYALNFEPKNDTFSHNFLTSHVHHFSKKGRRKLLDWYHNVCLYIFNFHIGGRRIEAHMCMGGEEASCSWCLLTIIRVAPVITNMHGVCEYRRHTYIYICIYIYIHSNAQVCVYMNIWRARARLLLFTRARARLLVLKTLEPTWYLSQNAWMISFPEGKQSIFWVMDLGGFH